MALTVQQLNDVRRFCGYPLVGTTLNLANNSDNVYMWFGMVEMSLNTRLTTLSASEEATITTVYLPNLLLIEAALIAAYGNLDTDAASVWAHNKNETNDRNAHFAMVRRQLCGFVGVTPGPSLNSGMSISRA